LFSANLTITVPPPLHVNHQFKNFGVIYAQPINIIMGGFGGGFASLIFGRVKKLDLASSVIDVL
jgi:hypothetical protein